MTINSRITENRASKCFSEGLSTNSESQGAMLFKHDDKAFSRIYGVKAVAIAGCSGLAIMAGSAMAQTSSFGSPSYDVSCRKGDEIRQILIVSPGEKGKACDVIYSKNRGRDVSTPFYANGNVGFCTDKAATIKQRLVSANYECSGIGNQITARAKAPQAAAPIKADTKVAQEEVAQTTLADTNAEALSAREAFLKRLRTGRTQPVEASASAAPEQTTVIAQPQIPPQIPSKNQEILQDQLSGPAPELASVTQTIPAPAAALIEAQSLRVPEKVAAIAPVAKTSLPSTSPTSVSAVSGPTALVSESANLQSLPRPTRKINQYALASREDTANKFVGATPVVLASNVETPVAASASNAAVASAANTTVSQSSSAAPSGVSGLLSSVLPNAQSDQPLSRPNIIRATLFAKAAAWNEGDIEAFMEGYWRDSDLRFVSGTQVSKGWNNTLKRYKKRYGNGDALGQLAYEDLNVQMVNEDVAVVVGRFVLERSDDEISSGAFTLVMKRFEGAWRIIHDHTVADPVVVDVTP